jgi:hypothetical protein
MLDDKIWKRKMDLEKQKNQREKNYYIVVFCENLVFFLIIIIINRHGITY